jgi:hypothetical protein
MRNNARIMAGIQVEIRENELLHQIEELQINVHHLNILANPIPHPIPTYPNLGPQVILANDEGMEVDANDAAVPEEENEDEELEPIEDDEGEAVYDANPTRMRSLALALS